MISIFFLNVVLIFLLWERRVSQFVKSSFVFGHFLDSGIFGCVYICCGSALHFIVIRVFRLNIAGAWDKNYGGSECLFRAPAIFCLVVLSAFFSSVCHWRHILLLFEKFAESRLVGEI